MPHLSGKQYIAKAPLSNKLSLEITCQIYVLVMIIYLIVNIFGAKFLHHLNLLGTSISQLTMNEF